MYNEKVWTVSERICETSEYIIVNDCAARGLRYISVGRQQSDMASLSLLMSAIDSLESKKGDVVKWHSLNAPPLVIMSSFGLYACNSCLLKPISI